MRHPFAQLTAFAVTAFAIGVAYRYVWDDPSQGSIANYMRSGAHAMGLAACGLGAHLYFNARLSKRLLHPVQPPPDVAEHLAPLTWLLGAFGDEQALTQGVRQPAMSPPGAEVV